MEREFIDWTAVGEDDTTPARSRRRRLGRVSNKALFGGSVVLLAMAGASVVQATTGIGLREGVRNGTATNETQIISKVTGNQYGTRQSNVSTGPTAGGSAIYGCRRPTLECTRASNLDKGPAAAFQTKGLVPFTISPTATGVVPHLNADKLDGLDATDIAKATLTGKAATAGAADTATTADTAKAVTGRTPYGKMTFVDSSKSDADVAAARAGATAVDLASFGPFKVYGKCFIDSDAGSGAGPQLRAEVYISTTQSGALLAGSSDSLTGSPDYLDTTTLEADRQLDTVTVNDPDRANFDGTEESNTAVAPDGTVTTVKAVMAAKQGTPAAGNGIYGVGSRCGFAVAIDG